MGRVINLGSGREISVGDLVRLIAGMMNRNIKLSSERRRLRPGQSEVERLLPDGGLARSLLGWQPAISLEDGLRRTICLVCRKWRALSLRRLCPLIPQALPLQLYP